jgi:hypothetical protein
MYLLENQTLSTIYQWSNVTQGQRTYYAQIQQFSLNTTAQKLSRTGMYHASAFAGNGFLREFGNPSRQTPKTFVLSNSSSGSNQHTSYLGEWQINGSTLEIKSAQLLSPGFTFSARPTPDERFLLNSWITNTALMNGNLYLLEQSYNGSFILRKQIVTNRGVLFAMNSSFYLQDEAPSICEYTYDLEKVNCVSGSGLIKANDQDLFLLTNSALSIMNPNSLIQTAQLTFPGITSVDAAFPDEGFILFSGGGSIYKTEVHPSTASFGNVCETTLPAYLLYALIPGTTHTLSATFAPQDNNTLSTFTKTFTPKASTALIDPACSFDFNRPLGTALNFTLSSRCVNDPDARAWWSTNVAEPTYGFSAMLKDPTIVMFSFSNLDLGLRLSQVTTLSPNLLVASTSADNGAPNIRILDTLQETASSTLTPRDTRLVALINMNAEDSLCINGITIRSSYQQNITTFCGPLSNPLNLTMLSSMVLPMGNSNGTEYLGPSFYVYPITSKLIGFQTAKSGTPQKYYWAFYNISDPRNPQLVYANDTYPFGTPSNTVTGTKFDTATPFKDGLFLNEFGQLYEWESPFNFSNPRWVTRAQLPAPSAPSAIYDPYTVFDQDFVAYVTNAGRIHIWDLTDPTNPRLCADQGGAIQFASLALSDDEQRLAAIDVTHKISVFSVVRFADDTFGLSLLSEVQTPVTSVNTKLYWPPNHNQELWKIPLGQTPGTTLYRITPPNGDWRPQYQVSGTVNSLQTRILNLGFTDGLSRQLSIPISITGTPLPVVASSSALTPLGPNAYAYTLEFNGVQTFAPGTPTPTFLIDLGALFTSPNQAYAPGTSLSFFFGEATLPSFVTIFDRGQGRYALQIIGGIFPAQAVNLRPEGSLLNNTQPMIVQVGDTLGSSGIDLHLVLRVQGNKPSMKKSLGIRGSTGDSLTIALPDTVTGQNTHGFLDNTDGLDSCYEARNTPAWMTIECTEATVEVPPNSVGTTVFNVRPRTFVPGTGELVGVGDWQNASFTNPGQPYARPLGDLMPAGLALRLKIGVPFSVELHPASTLFRFSDGSYLSTYRTQTTGATRFNSTFSPQSGLWSGVVLSPASSLSLTVTASQPAVFAAPETASVSAMASVEPSLTVAIGDISLREGTLGDLPLIVSTSALADTLDITVQCAPLSGSPVGTVFQLPAEFSPFIDTSTPISGRISLRRVPVSLLILIEETAGIATYRLPLAVSLAEGQNLYWNIDSTVQDTFNPLATVSTTSVVQEKPRAPEVDAEAALLSSDSLPQGTRVQVRLDGLFANPAGGVAYYALTSRDPSVVQVLAGSATSPFRSLLALSPGSSSLTACLTNRHNLTACSTPQVIRVPDPTTPVNNPRASDPWPSIGSGVGVVGVLLCVLVLVGPILHSYKKQQHQANDLIRRNTLRAGERKAFLRGLEGLNETVLSDTLTAAEQRLISLADVALIEALKTLFRGYLSLHSTTPAIPSSTRLTLAITRLKEAIGGVSRAGNPQSTVNQLIALLTFSALLAATRHENAHPVGYDWRINMLRWIDDQVSLLQGKAALDTQIKALFKLIRHTLQPLTTNETPIHYFLRHLTSIPVMVLRYCRSRRDQGDARETEKTIDGVLAFWSATEQPKLARSMAASLNSEKDWRLKVLGVMIFHALGDTSRLNNVLPRQLSDRERGLISRFLCGCHKKPTARKSFRPSQLAAHLGSTPPVHIEGKAGPTEETLHRAPGASPTYSSIANPLRENNGAKKTSLPGQVPPPPPLPAAPPGMATTPMAARVHALRGTSKPKPPAPTTPAGSPGGTLDGLSPTTAQAFLHPPGTGVGLEKASQEP